MLELHMELLKVLRDENKKVFMAHKKKSEMKGKCKNPHMMDHAKSKPMKKHMPRGK